jgi:hypothetical protein
VKFIKIAEAIAKINHVNEPLINKLHFFFMAVGLHYLVVVLLLNKAETWKKY